MRNLVGIQFFARGEGAGRAPANFSNNGPQVLTNDDLSKLFVREMKAMEVVLVEEMAKRTMADIMHQRRNAQDGFDVVGRRHIGDRLLEKRIEMPGKSPGHVHGPERVNKAGMFRRGIDPAGALELINVP